MRSTKNRARFKQNRSRSNGNIINRVFESSGPDGKVRGTPQQIIDKYNQLARDAHLANDPVATQSFHQHAEYYTRILSIAQREAELRREKHEAQNNGREEHHPEQDEAPEASAPETSDSDAGGADATPGSNQIDAA